MDSVSISHEWMAERKKVDHSSELMWKIGELRELILEVKEEALR